MGIAGSATATLVSQTITLGLIIAWLWRKDSILILKRQDWPLLKPDLTIMRSLVTKGLPMGLQMVVISLSMIVMYSLVNGFGSQTTAAFGACMQLWNYIQMPSFAIMAAASSMAAQNVGAGLWQRVHGVARSGVAVNVLLTGGLVALVYAFDRAGLGLFLPGDSVALAIGQHVNATVVWSFVFFGVSMVLAGVVRATGAVVPPLLILFVALWLVRIPFAYALLPHWGADAVWWSFPLGSLVSLLLTVAYYRYGGWRQTHMLSAPGVPAAAVAAQASADARTR